MGRRDARLRPLRPCTPAAASIAVTFTGGWSGLQLGRNDRGRRQRPTTSCASGCTAAERRAADRRSRSATTSRASADAHGDARSGRVDAGRRAARRPRHDAGHLRVLVQRHRRRAGDLLPRRRRLPRHRHADADAARPAPARRCSVDAGAGRHPISPYIYGMNFADESLAAELRLPVRRWGGNATTRYNWQNDTSQPRQRLVLREHPERQSPTRRAARRLEQRSVRRAEPPHRHGDAADRAADRLDAARRAPTRAASASPSTARSSRPTRGRPDCGNGVRTNGTDDHRQRPARHQRSAITPAFVQDWMRAPGRPLRQRRRPAACASTTSTTSRCCGTTRTATCIPRRRATTSCATAPTPTRRRSRRPTRSAQTLGPGRCGAGRPTSGRRSTAAPGGAWWNNPQDRLAHGNVPFVEWYLQQMRAYEQQHGARILDYLDLHYYPQAVGRGAVARRRRRDAGAAPALDALAVGSDLRRRELDRRAGAADPAHARLGGRATIPAPSSRSPSTTGARSTTSTARSPRPTCSASSAARGSTWRRCGIRPTASQPGAFAFRMYRNYDGAGGGFGDVERRRAASADQDAARHLRRPARRRRRADRDGHQQERDQPLTSAVTLSGFVAVGQRAGLPLQRREPVRRSSAWPIRR